MKYWEAVVKHSQLIRHAGMHIFWISHQWWQWLVDSFFQIINSFPECLGLCLAWLDVDNQMSCILFAAYFSKERIYFANKRRVAYISVWPKFQRGSSSSWVIEITSVVNLEWFTVSSFSLNLGRPGKGAVNKVYGWTRSWLQKDTECW